MRELTNRTMIKRMMDIFMVTPSVSSSNWPCSLLEHPWQGFDLLYRVRYPFFTRYRFKPQQANLTKCPMCSLDNVSL